MKQRKESIEFSFDLPEVAEGWEKAIMGQIADVVGGGTPDTSDETNFSDEGFPWLTPADLSNFKGIYIRCGKRCLSEKGLRSSSAVMMPKGTVLMSSRAPIGYLAIAAHSISTNQGFKSFVCHKAICPEFLFYWLRYLSPYLDSFGSGTTFLEISGSKAKQIPVLLAPLAEQKRIVAKVEELLARVNAARERLTKVQTILKRFRQSVLAAACSGRLTADWREQHIEIESASVLIERLWKTYPQWAVSAPLEEEAIPDIPEKWIWGIIGQIGDVITGNTPSKKEANYFGGPIPFFKPTDLDIGYYVKDSIDSLSQKGARLARVLPPLSVMVTCIGATIGKTGLARVEGATNQQINSVVTDRSFVSPYWLFWAITSPWLQEQIRLRASETTLPILNKGRFKKLPIPIPPLNEQNEIVCRVEALFKLADIIDNRVKTATLRAEKMIQAILAKAFRGELVATEAELARRECRPYEPASDLLARVIDDRGAKDNTRKIRSKRD